MVVAVAACIATACAAPVIQPLPVPVGATHSIYVVRRESHTGIAIAVADWPDRAWPVLADFPSSQYLEFGWGDAAYYQAETKTLSMTLAAVLWPTPSVMEVLGLTDISTQVSADYEAVEIQMSRHEVDSLADSIAASFSGDAVTLTGRTRLYEEGESRFYHAHGEFHLFRMCNRWTAQRLKAAGCAIGRWPVATATRVLREARRCQSANRAAGVVADEAR